MIHRWLFLLLLPILPFGCADSKPAPAKPISLEPVVSVVHALPRNLERRVAHPGVIESYERTAIYAKIAGFVQTWHVDIGDEVQAGETLVELAAPEVVEQRKQMQAQVNLDRVMVEQARKLVTVAAANVTASVEMVAQAATDITRYQADVDRWQGEVKRLTELVKERVVDQQVLDETRRQFKSSQAALESARVSVRSRDAQRLAAEATWEKTKVDVAAAEAKVKVAEAEERRLAALVGYLTITAPYDGVVFVRNVNSGDFVLPATGDPSLGVNSLGLSPSRATPLYVLIRKDPVLFVIGVPEADAHYVGRGAKARVRVPELAQHEFPAQVTRTSWALDSASRTLLAQIELPNAQARFLPGMYAYGYVLLERSNVRALPMTAITQIGNQTYCYMVVDGKAVRTEVQTGFSDGKYVEVIEKFAKAPGASDGEWAPFDGAEAVIAGDLTEISDGAPVTVGHGN
jgi:HlyD family secretion protein